LLKSYNLFPSKGCKKFILFYSNYQKIVENCQKITRWTLSEEWDGGALVELAAAERGRKKSGIRTLEIRTVRWRLK
jgi:hypothetical protein